MPLPTTGSMWKWCLVALRPNKMPQVAVKNGRRKFISKRLRDFCRRRMKRKPKIPLSERLMVYFSCRQSCYWPFFHFLNAGTAYISWDVRASSSVCFSHLVFCSRFHMRWWLRTLRIHLGWYVLYFHSICCHSSLRRDSYFSPVKSTRRYQRSSH